MDSWDSGQSINDVNKPVLIRAKAKYTGDVKIFLTINVPPTSQPVREGNAIELFYEDVRSSNYYIFGIGRNYISIILDRNMFVFFVF